MSYPISTFQQLLKTCLKLLYGLIFAVLLFAFMILPQTLISETLISETTTSAALVYHPVSAHLEVSEIARAYI
ncbi:MAG: hypothetical protein L7W39_04730 [Alphaproteobacteria bacterium]|nr:hypothetical protein [Alphaproteobacteria bacterium]